MLPNKDPIIKAAESHAQTDITIAKVIDVSIKESNCLISIAVPKSVGMYKTPPIVTAMFIDEPFFIENNSQIKIRSTIRIKEPTISKDVISGCT